MPAASAARRSAAGGRCGSFCSFLVIFNSKCRISPLFLACKEEMDAVGANFLHFVLKFPLIYGVLYNKMDLFDRQRWLASEHVRHLTEDSDDLAYLLR